MVNLGTNVCFACDRQQFINCGDHVGTFIAHVGYVHAVVFGSHFGQGDQFISLCKETGWIHQRRRHAQSTVFHRLSNECAHLVELFGRRCTVFVSDDVPARYCRTNERCHVGRDATSFEILKVFRQRRPLDVVADISLQFGHLRFHGVVERAHGFAFAHDLERHALANIALRATVLDQRFVGPGHHVHKAGRHGESLNIDFNDRGGIPNVAKRNYLVAINGDVADKRFSTTAVVNIAATQDEVV